MVPASHKILAGNLREHLRLCSELFLVSLKTRLGDDDVLARHRRVEGFGDADDGVVDVRPDGDGEIRGQGPRRGRPDEDQLGALRPLADRLDQPHADGDRLILAVLVNLVVHLQLVVGQRGSIVPAVWKDPVALVDEALVVERLERPHDGLHVGGVEGLVVVVEVDPSRLAGDVLLPFVGVAEH